MVVVAFLKMVWAYRHKLVREPTLDVLSGPALLKYTIAVPAVSIVLWEQGVMAVVVSDPADMIFRLINPVAEYRDRILRKQIFDEVSEADLAKLAVATAILDQLELIEIHLPKLVAVTRLLVRKHTSDKHPASK